MADAGVVTRPGSLFGWAPLRSFIGLAKTGAFAAHLTAFVTLRQLVLGRRLAVRHDDGELVMTIVEADSRLAGAGWRSANSTTFVWSPIRSAGTNTVSV